MADKQSILLIYPPVAKPCEPPAGIARLAGVLRAGGIDCRVVDACLDDIVHSTYLENAGRIFIALNLEWDRERLRPINKHEYTDQLHSIEQRTGT